MKKQEKINSAIAKGQKIRNMFSNGNIVSTQYVVVNDYLDELRRTFKNYKKYRSSKLESAVTNHNFGQCNPLIDLNLALSSLTML